MDTGRAEEIDLFVCSHSSSLSDDYVQESVYQTIENLLIKIKLMISKMKEFAANLKKDLQTQVKSMQLSSRLKKLRKELAEKESQGVQTVSLIDYNKFNKFYHDYSYVLTDTLKKLSDYRRYNNRAKFLKDVETLNKDIEVFNEELKKIEQNPKKIPMKKAIDFVESELDGSSKVWKTYIGVIDNLTKIENALERYKKDARSVSNDYLETQHVNVIVRCMGKIQKVMQNHLSKFIGLVVFRFH